MIGKLVKDYFKVLDEYARDNIAADQYGFDIKTSAANRIKAIKAKEELEKCIQEWEKCNQEVDK